MSEINAGITGDKDVEHQTPRGLQREARGRDKLIAHSVALVGITQPPQRSFEWGFGFLLVLSSCHHDTGDQSSQKIITRVVCCCVASFECICASDKRDWEGRRFEPPTSMAVQETEAKYECTTVVDLHFASKLELNMSFTSSFVLLLVIQPFLTVTSVQHGELSSANGVAHTLRNRAISTTSAFTSPSRQ